MSEKEIVAWPSAGERSKMQQSVADQLGESLERLTLNPVSPSLDLEQAQRAVAEFDFDRPARTAEVASKVIEQLEGGMVHMMHPTYFGLFNPSVVFPGVLADLITATFNPQLAAWSHAPIPVEMERRVIREFGALYGPDFGAGHFTTGGAEANYTAVLLALTRSESGYGERGASAFSGTPCLYVSRESHLAWYKIAHQCGIGRSAVRLVATDGCGRMSIEDLEAQLERDRAAGCVPVFVGATAGTTNAGEFDSLAECGRIAEREHMWFHVDAAWGGALRLLPECDAVFAGSEQADSVTLDAHKWLSVPMGAGMILCKDDALLGETFRVSANYMPQSLAALDPYTHTVQWSRRFIGLKLFLSLATLGWSGYRDLLRRSLKVAAQLESALEADSWRVVNESPVAVICFEDSDRSLDLEAVAEAVILSGRAWISSALFEGRTVLRACVTNHQTNEEHLRELVAALAEARARVT